MTPIPLGILANQVGIPPELSVTALVVAGGGSGGGNTARGSGGGGAGGMRTVTATLATLTNFSVTIGAGGTNRGQGNSSTFNNIANTGGGKGGMFGFDEAAGNGGSGGGGGFNTNQGNGISGQGNKGGQHNKSSNQVANSAGGGGGKGAAGETSRGFDGKGQTGGAGGSTSIITTTNATNQAVGEVSGGDVFFAGGGAGSGAVLISDNDFPFTFGGVGGGGHAGARRETDATYRPGEAGHVNSGGGSGGFGPSNGGSGVVILRYDAARTCILGAGLSGTTDLDDNGSKITIIKSGTGNVQFS